MALAIKHRNDGTGPWYFWEDEDSGIASDDFVTRDEAEQDAARHATIVRLHQRTERDGWQCVKRGDMRDEAIFDAKDRAWIEEAILMGDWTLIVGDSMYELVRSKA